MSFGSEDMQAVIVYRKEKAYATLKEAEDMIATEHWNLACIMLVFIWLQLC